NKIRHLRQFLRGWAKNESGIYKKEKERMLQLIQTLDIRAETTLLDPTKQACKSEAEAKLRSLLREE
uniref:Uncharacterized protein n=1 Tax=Aegilops tauschii subsp. strangulata TaxID=200361 RepID=A0A453QP60_AEGTS